MTSEGILGHEPNPKWVRGIVDGRIVVDSRAVELVWEHPWYPTWYLPLRDIAAEVRVDGPGEPGDLMVGDRILSGVVRRPAVDDPELQERVVIAFDALDHWFEEDVEVFVHPRDPHKRVDVLASSRHVRVLVDDTVVADTDRPVAVFETGLPVRWYLRPTDVRLDLLTPTTTTTGCPYKGTARYWDVSVNGRVHHDLVWSYPTPLPESAGIAGLMCFYDDREGDGVVVEVDGVARRRPDTPFS